VNESLFLNPILIEEIENYLNLLKDECSYYEYGMTNYFLKRSSKLISLPLSLIFNKAIECGVYPDCFKKCIIIPLFKTGDKNDCGNYRPISFSLSISKIFEKCLKKRLYNFLIKNNFFPKNQYDFQSGKSTHDALVQADKYIRENLDNNNKVMGIFLDLKKAFDSVNHSILINKLEYAGVRGKALDLFSSFLVERYQAVRVDNILSNFLPINYGVPQGTVLGPLFFIIYTNGLLSLNLNAKIISFAYDTLILVSGASNNIVNILATFVL
jgi:retron-type reverse transcriptase